MFKTQSYNNFSNLQLFTDIFHFSLLHNQPFILNRKKVLKNFVSSERLSNFALAKTQEAQATLRKAAQKQAADERKTDGGIAQLVRASDS